MALLYEDLSYKLRGMFFTIYNEPGPGFKEDVYARALLKLLDGSNVSYEREKQFQITFGDEEVGTARVDLVIDNTILIEVKATEIPNSVFEKQTLSYLKSTGLPLAFLVNFGMKRLYIKRFANTKPQPLSAKSISKDAGILLTKESA